MKEMLKGNYQLKIKEKPKNPEAAKEAESAIQSAFEASALERLGGSIAFVKKSTNFVWKGK